MKRNVIVFGASGEIGGRIARLAVDAGHQVYGISRGLNKRETVNMEGVEIIHGDKNDADFLRQLHKKLDYDAVIDSVPNLKTIKLLQEGLPKAENVLFCSSTGTFVPLQYFPADEQHPWRQDSGINFYPQCQRDALAFDEFTKNAFPVTILRPSNIIGAGRIPLELWGGRDIEFFQTLKAGKLLNIPPCEDIMVQSGHNWDLASAFVKALDFPDAIRGELFIISCRKAITLGTYLQTAMDYLKSKSTIVQVDPHQLYKIYPQVTWKYRLEFLMQHMCLDVSKAEKVFGYAPAKTTQEGLLDALQWCEKTGIL